MQNPHLPPLSFANLAVIDEMYIQYRKDPGSVDPSWRRYFQQNGGEEAQRETTAGGREQLRIYNLIEAYRTHGHRYADINPIATHNIGLPHILDPITYGIRDEEMDALFPTWGILQEGEAPLSVIIDTLKKTYCGKIGIEYKHAFLPELETWIQEQIEPSKMRPNLSIDDKRMILELLNRSELFEVFLHTKYSGQKRFSLEGGETLIPILKAIIERGSQIGAEAFYLGMAHRGRLNVLSNILEKSFEEIFDEFEESYIPQSIEGSGDVKYHLGFYSEQETRQGHKVFINLAPNPSHLEAVNPVVEGQVRAQQVLRGDHQKQKHAVIPILIHGDAALSGQGICYETLQLTHLCGYGNGGTIHVVINNQIGFTTHPKDGRSTPYCTDIAKAFRAPVFHVNVEDPEGCVYAALLSMEIRQRFGLEVFIDLNCFRKYGHNETDEPAFTQPLEYQIIRKKRSVREHYRDDLIKQGILERQMAEALEEEFRQKLKLAQEGRTISFDEGKRPAPRVPTEHEKAPTSTFEKVETPVNKKTLEQITEALCRLPEAFTAHRKVLSLYKDRMSMVIPEGDEPLKPLDWGMCETLAYGTLLEEGVHIRLSGQDSRRGTFSHRHAMIVDQKAEKKYFPLNHLSDKQGRFDVFNSPLSEYGCLGFEFGYSIERQDALVIWEAQFGDFCNGAQIIIDQFLSTAEQKWGQKLRLTLLLPHGYEGQGPEHSSGRIERFLLLAGQQNVRVVQPTTPAQLFHLLRRQVHSPVSKPLIVFTPKGLLRHRLCVSTLNDLTSGSFKEVLDDPLEPKNPKRIALCSGRIYYDLTEARERHGTDDLALIRVEQLYPLNSEAIHTLIKKYGSAKEIIWAQDEPQNMGPWDFIRPYLRSLLPKGASLHYVGRERSASPAAGSYHLHRKQHAAILDAVFPQPKVMA